MKHHHSISRIAGLLTLLLGVSAPLQAEPEAAASVEVIIDGVVMGQFTHDYDAALEYAAENDFPILLNFNGSDWCIWCKVMAENVFTKPEWQAYARESIVQVWLDYPEDPSLVPEKYRERNDRLNQQYGIEGFPTFIILNSKGQRIGQLGAGRDETPASFQASVEGILLMTEKGINAYAAKLSAEDSEKVLAAFKDFDGKRAEVARLEGALSAAREASLESRAALEAALEAGMFNTLPETDQAAYNAAKAALAEAEKALEDWLKENGQRRPTPELREQIERLNEALLEAFNKVQSFRLK